MLWSGSMSRAMRADCAFMVLASDEVMIYSCSACSWTWAYVASVQVPFVDECGFFRALGGARHGIFPMRRRRCAGDPSAQPDLALETQLVRMARRQHIIECHV